MRERERETEKPKKEISEYERKRDLQGDIDDVVHSFPRNINKEITSVSIFGEKDRGGRIGIEHDRKLGLRE